MVQAEATAKYIRTSAQKAGLVLALIRGRAVNQALATLKFTRKTVAKDIAKVLQSAIANAQQKDGFGGDVDRLFVVGVLRQQRAVAEARAAGADGPGVSRGQAHHAPDGGRERAAGEGGGGGRGDPARPRKKAAPKATKAAPKARAKKADKE